ncbi:reactive chlorine resistance periplasmic protein RclB, partial [Salmonella enterica]|uniref:reactive chlorine resistance periplasmic protein RclB n=1 Tax=Salmonella enterica TaxID=28901 RepID=UPI0007791552
MLKVTTLIASFLAAPLACSASAQPLTDVEYFSVSAVSATPSMLEDSIARLAQSIQASSWNITSMRIDNTGYATAI